jgi:hypothetical protein
MLKQGPYAYIEPEVESEDGDVDMLLPERGGGKDKFKRLFKQRPVLLSPTHAVTT